MDEGWTIDFRGLMEFPSLGEGYREGRERTEGTERDR